MGLLNFKTRIMDTIITQVGKQQLSSGKMKAEFYAFSDASVFYNPDTSMSSSEGPINNRVYLEANNLPQDQITFEADDSGKLVPRPSTGFLIKNGKIFSGSADLTPLSGTEFASTAGLLLDSFINNFNNQYILASPDIFDNTRDEFIISNETIDFDITENNPIPKTDTQVINVNNIESFFMDKKLSHVPNFNYLPPVNKAKLGTNQVSPLGVYQSVGQEPIFEYEDLKKELDILEQKGYKRDIDFIETSRDNNVVMQFFESSNSELLKLDVIDFGLFNSKNTEISKQELEKIINEGRANQLENTTKHVFFAGKVITDSYGCDSYIHLFTLVFS